MRKLLLATIVLIAIPFTALASEEKCDCHAKTLSDHCKKECEAKKDKH